MLIAESKGGMFAFLRKKKFVAHTNKRYQGKELGKKSPTDKRIYDLTNELQSKSKSNARVLIVQEVKQTRPQKKQEAQAKTVQELWVGAAAIQGKKYVGASIVRLVLPQGNQGQDNASSTHSFFLSWLLAIGIVGVLLFFLRGNFSHAVIVIGLASVALYPYVASVNTARQSRFKPWEQRQQLLEHILQQTPNMEQDVFVSLLPDTPKERSFLAWNSKTSKPPHVRVLRSQLRTQPVAVAAWPFVMLGGLALLFYSLFAFGVASGAGRLLQQHKAAYAYTSPAMLGMALLVFVPFAVGIGLAFFQHHGGGKYSFVGIQNFIDILYVPWKKLASPLSFYFTLGVTLLWTSLNVFLHVSIGLGLALLLKNPLLRMKGIYRVLLILPWAVPNYITALIWKGMFHKQFGAINALLATFGIGEIGWFSSFATAFSANLITNTWLGFPFMMVVSLGALQSIPESLYEAADVDGANRWQKFRFITLPLLRPALFPAIILGSIWTFNMFNIIYLVSAGAPDGATDILITEAYRWAFQRGDRFGYAAAYSVIIFLILLGYSLVTQRVTKATEEIFQEK